MTAAPTLAEAEILIHYLTQRITDLTHEVGERENQVLKESLEIEQGTRQEFSRDPNTWTRVALQMLDSAAALDFHNRLHSASPWADTEDIIARMCTFADKINGILKEGGEPPQGDCSTARWLRAAAMEAARKKALGTK